MASGDSDRDAEYALSKLLPIGTVAEYQNEFEILINRENCYSILNANEVNNTKPPLSVDTFGNNGGDDSENSNPVTSAEEAVDSRHSSTLSSSVEHESPRVLQLKERIGIGEVHELMKNEGSHNFVQPNVGERMCLQAMVMGRTYQGFGGSREEATWEWMPDSQSAYSLYHLEGVGSVTPGLAPIVEPRPKRTTSKPQLEGEIHKSGRYNALWGGVVAKTRRDNTKAISNMGLADRDAEDALSKLLQISTAAEYQDEFEMLINRVMRISESLLTSFYFSGHKVALQIELLRARPTTLGEAFSLARIIETRFDDERCTLAIAKPNDLNIRVHVQDLEDMTRHKPNKVEVIKSSGSSLLVESKYYAANQVVLIFNQSNEAMYYERILKLIARQMYQYLCKHILDFGYDLQEANLQLKTWNPEINFFRHHLEDKVTFEGVESDTHVRENVVNIFKSLGSFHNEEPNKDELYVDFSLVYFGVRKHNVNCNTVYLLVNKDAEWSELVSMGLKVLETLYALRRYGHNVACLLPEKLVSNILRRRKGRCLNLTPWVVAEAFSSIEDPLVIVFLGDEGPKIHALCDIFVDLQIFREEIKSVLVSRKTTLGIQNPLKNDDCGTIDEATCYRMLHSVCVDPLDGDRELASRLKGCYYPDTIRKGRTSDLTIGYLT
nr:UvrD-like helicase, ATP-binding domain, P-loop containing nucleoside triphosphate hydrolase [Tanacetum cinerariifolium]